MLNRSRRAVYLRHRRAILLHPAFAKITAPQLLFLLCGFKRGEDAIKCGERQADATGGQVAVMQEGSRRYGAHHKLKLGQAHPLSYEKAYVGMPDGIAIDRFGLL